MKGWVMTIGWLGGLSLFVTWAVQYDTPWSMATTWEGWIWPLIIAGSVSGLTAVLPIVAHIKGKAAREAAAAAAGPAQDFGPDETFGDRLRLGLATLAGLVIAIAGIVWMLNTFVMGAPGIDGRWGPFMAAMALMFGGIYGLVSGAMGLVSLTQAELEASELASGDPAPDGSDR